MKKLIENINDMRKSLNEISVYDLNVYSAIELYYKLALKTNEVITELSRFEGVISDEIIEQNEKLTYLLGEGLNIEVVKKINQMIADGTMDTIINHNVFNSLNNKIKENATQLKNISLLNKYKYAMFTFEAVNLTDSNSKLVILLSDDGISWSKLENNYTSPNLRDPYCFIKDEYFYITATNLVKEDKIIYLRSKDLVTFEEVEYNYTGLSGYVRRWAPSVFKKGNNYYMTISLSTNDSIYDMNQYISKLDNNLLPTSWEKININGNATSIYDAHFIITDKKNYIYYKNTQIGYEGIEIAQSDTLTGQYEIIGNIETDNRKEAPFIFKIEDKLRLYLDTYEGEGGTTYKDMVYDLDYNKDIITNTHKKYKHCHILDLTGNQWESNFVLEPNFITLNDCNNKSITRYSNRSINPNTLNLPNILNSDEKYGKISLYETGGGNLNQELHLLNNRHFYRNFVSGTWSSWVEVLKDSNITNTVLKPVINVGGGIDINVLNVNGNKVVNIQGNLTNINKSQTVQNLFTIDTNYKTKKNITIQAVNINNWGDKHPLIELKTDGKVNLLIPGESTLTQSNYVFFNVTYVV